jgi:hypothetical protein
MAQALGFMFHQRAVSALNRSGCAVSAFDSMGSGCTILACGLDEVSRENTSLPKKCGEPEQK